MMTLGEGQVCPYGVNCPYNVNALGEPCHGTMASRKNTFTCDYVINGKIIEDGSPRIPGDKTGRMKVIMG